MINGKKTVLVTMGGALYGPYQVGWAVVLDEKDLLQDVDVIVGSSVGAINGGLISKNIKNIDKCRKTWFTINKSTDVYERKLNIETVVWQGITGSESILLPKPLYEIIKKEFAGIPNFIRLPIPVMVTSTKLKDSECDGGVVDNNPIDIALDVLHADKIILLGCSPDVEKNRLKIYQGFDDVILSLIKSSAFPVVFPTIPNDPKHPVKMLDVAKETLLAFADGVEENAWKTKYFYEKLSILDQKVKRKYPDWVEEYPVVKWIEGYPKVALPHDMFDCTHVKDDYEQGMKDAREYLTDEVIAEFRA